MITATVVAGSVAKQLNLGSIVALLVVGMALGPHSPRPLLTGHIEELQTVGEIGVILLLFLVGLETQPGKLSSMRRLFFGLGTAQYLLTTIAIAGLLIAVAHLHWQSALIIALGLAMSSDAIAIASLEEHAETASPQSRAVMAVVIYQCFMTIPVLAMIPLLAAGPMQGAPVPWVFETLEVCAAIANRLPVHPLRAAEDPGYGSPEIRHTSVYSDRHRRHLCGGMGHGHGWLVERIGRFHGRHDPLRLRVRLSDQGVSVVDQGTFTQRVLHRHRDVNQFEGGHRDRRRIIAITYRSLLLLKVAVVIALGLCFSPGVSRVCPGRPACWRPLMKSPTSSFPARTEAVC